MINEPIDVSEKEKRLFFGFEVTAPWPNRYPKGRVIQDSSRHLTLAFLGNVSHSKLQPLPDKLPSLPFSIGPVGKYDHCLLLPPRRSRVVAWHVSWLTCAKEIDHFHHMLLDFLKEQHFQLDERPLLSHVTICRSPFIEREWKESFQSLPCMVRALHLYESVGHLTYHPLWSLPLQEAFEEIEHTADIAYKIYGTSLSDLFIHAQIALSFRFPPLLTYMESKTIHSLDTLIMALNEVVFRADSELGCPFKAVSFHGKLEENHGILQWEMIVDV